MISINEEFWVAAAFVVLVLLIMRPVKKIFLGILDRYITDTKNTLEEAEQLKIEAQKRLNEAQSKLDETKDLAESVLKRSEEEVSSIIDNAQAFAKEESEKQLKIITTNFEARKQKLLSEIKEHAVDRAMHEITERFNEKLEKEDENALLEFGIDNVKRTVH